MPQTSQNVSTYSFPSSSICLQVASIPSQPCLYSPVLQSSYPLCFWLKPSPCPQHSLSTLLFLWVPWATQSHQISLLCPRNFIPLGMEPKNIWGHLISDCIIQTYSSVFVLNMYILKCGKPCGEPLSLEVSPSPPTELPSLGLPGNLHFHNVSRRFLCPEAL